MPSRSDGGRLTKVKFREVQCRELGSVERGEMTVAIGFYAFLGLLLAGLAVPLLRRKVPPNR